MSPKEFFHIDRRSPSGTEELLCSPQTSGTQGRVLTGTKDVADNLYSDIVSRMKKVED